MDGSRRAPVGRRRHRSGRIGGRDVFRPTRLRPAPGASGGRADVRPVHRGSVRRAPRGPEPLLHHLPQRSPADRWAEPGRGQRRRRGPEPPCGRLRAGDPEAANRRDAAARAPASGRGDLRRGGEPARGGYRPCRRGEPRPRPDQHRPPAEPHRVPQRDSRPARFGSRRDAAAAGRRDLGHRLRQQRRRPLDLHGAARAVSLGGAHHHAARHGVDADRPGLRDLRRAPSAAAGRAPERGHAARLAGRRRHPVSLPGRRGLPDQDSSCAPTGRTTSSAWAAPTYSTFASTASWSSG